MANKIQPKKRKTPKLTKVKPVRLDSKFSTSIPALWYIKNKL